MKKRKLIKNALLCGPYLWFVFLICCIIAGLTRSITPIIFGLVIGFFVCLINMILLDGIFAKGGFTRDWFKTQDELQKEVLENRELNQELGQAALIIGNHEVVRLYKEEKERQKIINEDFIIT